MAAAWCRNLSYFKHCSFFPLKSNKLYPLTKNYVGKALFCSAAKPYAFHPRTRTLESKEQALYLTKTIVNGEVPTRLQNNSIDEGLRQELMDSYKQSVIQTRLYNYDGERSTKTTCALPLMMNMLKAVWSQSARFPGLHDMSLSYKPHVSAVWKRHDDLVQVSGNLGFLLSSKQSLPAFVSETDIENTEQQNLNSLDLIAPVFDLQQVASKASTDTGFYPGSPYPYAHTLVVVNTEKHWSVEDRCAQGLMFTFGRLIAQATCLHGHNIGEVLKQPLSAQCVISDGFRLSFLSVQLNTLEFAIDEGIKNIAWILPAVPMYEKVFYNEAESKPEVEGFNEDCFEIFTKIITSGLAQ